MKILTYMNTQKISETANNMTNKYEVETILNKCRKGINS